MVGHYFPPRPKQTAAVTRLSDAFCCGAASHSSISVAEVPAAGRSGLAWLAAGEVFTSGPDDPALFDTVINLPADQPSIAGSIGNAGGEATPTTQLNVADGGSVGERFQALSGSEVNLVGVEFLLDGELLDELALGETLVISERDVTLLGILADGSPFSFDLNSNFSFSSDFFSSDATLTVTLIPEPFSLVLLALGALAFADSRRRA